MAEVCDEAIAETVDILEREREDRTERKGRIETEKGGVDGGI